MGAGCSTKQEDVISITENIQGNGEDVRNNFDSVYTTLKNGKGTIIDTESLSSGNSSRPPTPFSRPLTAAIIARPKTTTIFEKEGMEGDDEEDGAEGHVVNVLNLEDQPPEATRALRRSTSRNSLDSDHHPIRRISRHHLGDEEEIQKLKEYMSQKGL